jgi:hypothetical protein
VRSLKQQGGEALLQRVVKEAGPQTAGVFASRISKLSWQSYGSFVGLLTSADRVLGKGDLTVAHALGVEAGRQDLGTVLRVYVALSSAERLIRSCSSVWASYYRNAGSMHAITWEPEETVLQIAGFPDMAPAHCRLMEGWMTSTMSTLGFAVLPGACERSCPSRGGDVHEFWCQWARQRSR